MRINKTYLKLGATFTAAFGFGFIIGQTVERYKFKKAMEDLQQNMVKVRSEFKEATPQVIQYSPSIPELDTMNGEIIDFGITEDQLIEAMKQTKEESDMSKRGKRPDAFEMAWDEGFEVTHRRLEKYIEKQDDAAVRDIIQDLLIMFPERDGLWVRDDTPWGCPHEHPIFPIFLDTSTGEFYWNNLGVLSGEMNDRMITTVIAGIRCFSVYREDGNGQRFPIPNTLLEIINRKLAMAYDDRVYTFKTRSLYFPQIDREVFLWMESGADEKTINETLMDMVEIDAEYDELEE